MKKLYLGFIIAALLLIVTGCKPEETPDDEDPYPSYSKAVGWDYDYREINDYELVWSDEFEGEGLPDSTKWGYDVGGSGWGNNELQYYTNDQNAWLEDGNLVIEARAQNYMDRSYTSARLITKNKGDWLYGRFEIKAKLPSGRGTWPAIWMLPTDWVYGGWPRSGEIDIMEHVGYDQDTIVQSIHTNAFNHAINTQKGASRYIEGVSENFHVYRIDWYPEEIIFFIDDVQIYKFKPSNNLTYPTYEEWPFDKRFHLLLNIAVGGDWGGAQGVADDIWPQRMEVDYVRIYQSPTITNLERG